MANWLGQVNEAPPLGTAAARTPYRGMPVSPPPRRDWRPVVERGLALFNALALLAVAVWWIQGGRGLGGYKADQARVLTAVALGGSAGFLGWFPYGLRLKLILVSGFVWVMAGSVTLFYGFSRFPYVFRLFGNEHSATFGGYLFVAVGVLSVMTFLSRDRTRYRAGLKAPVTTAAHSSVSFP